MSKPIPDTLTIDISSVRTMTLAELRDLRPILNSLADVVMGFCAQSCLSDQGGRYKANGLIINDLTELLCAAHDAVYQAAKAATPQTAQEIEDRAWCMLGAKTEWREDIIELAAIATEAAHAHGVAAANERRAAS